MEQMGVGDGPGGGGAYDAPAGQEYDEQLYEQPGGKSAKPKRGRR